MGTSATIVQQAYEAFGRKDVPAILKLIADDVDWEFVGSASSPYAGRRRNRNEVRDFESEWVHVFTVRSGNVTRWRGFFNTAVRYGI